MDMDKEQDLLKRIQAGMPGFSKGQKLIANFIINHYDKAAYMTAAKLEKKWSKRVNGCKVCQRNRI